MTSDLRRVLSACELSALAEHFGGLRVTVPWAKNTPKFWTLALYIGPRAAARLVDVMGGTAVVVPSLIDLYGGLEFRDQRVRESARNGKAPETIARELGMTERHVRRLIAGVRR